MWDPATGDPPASLLEGVDAIVNLAGAPIAPGRWSEARKASIRDSRVGTTRLLVSAMAGTRVSVLVNASAVGIYGASEQPVGEQAPAGRGFLADLCVEWEEAAFVRPLASCSRARVWSSTETMVRFPSCGAWRGSVRSDGSVAAASGCRGSTWTTRSVRCCTASTTTSRGAVNLVAPDAVRQDAFAHALQRRAHRPWAPPTPGVVVRAGLGEAASLVLEGALVVPDALASSGYVHRFTSSTLRWTTSSAPDGHGRRDSLVVMALPPTMVA